MNQIERRRFLIQELLKENPEYMGISIPSKADEQRDLLRGLMNIRSPQAISHDFLTIQNEYLREETAAKGITELSDLEPVSEGIYLWQGDITTLRCDAIVNAANSGLTGCYAPCHGCIDNCIHTYAGVQLRLACAELMQRQGHEEETGKAKITLAYNLPCKYVLHTVGPIISHHVSQRDCDLLASCYRSCLNLAAENGCQSVAFCCISTGEFHFPNEQAAEIAVAAIKGFLQDDTRIRHIIFNVFKDRDLQIYRKLLEAKQC